ncbi:MULTISPECIES: flagellar filament capping protein FliD [Pseudomonas]|uniref:flagellar filament capping protein FliD n=1 Tax=Pseudomonas TaxID=286 RepID=UPI00257954A8|nr:MULTISPECIES: flagellar filament capping protein FliD [Pseudomonas]
MVTTTSTTGTTSTPTPATTTSSSSTKTSITGLGSGLDIDALVEVTVNAEKAPKQGQIDRLTAKTETSLSAVGTLKAAMEAFEASLTALTSKSTSFDGLSAKSSTETVATVTSKSGAVEGFYALNVTSLATASKVATASLSGGSATTFASGGKLKIDVGDNAHYSVNVSAGASLSSIRDSINSQLSSSAGITANIVTDSNGSRLVLSSETTGENTDIFMSGTGDLAALNVNVTSTTDGDGVTTVSHNLQKQSGTGAGYITLSGDAKFTLDGLEMSSSTNTTSALSGLTITLKGKGESTISMSTNTDGIKSSVETFVNAYNTLMTVTNALTKVTVSADGSTTDAGALVGDATIRTMMNSVRSAMVQPSTGSGSLSILAQLGVSTNKDGTLKLDEKALTAGVEANYDSVKSFFTGDDGLISRLGDVTSVYTAKGGLLESKQNSLQGTLDKLDDQQESLDRRIETLQTSLYKKYNTMDALVAQLNATSSSILETLNALNNKDN